ncbi:hypothetical protein L6227_02900 [Pseudomonas syringae pv. syringae]|uniref:hypothetical protein n=1 Tax=Pseudomonas syringae TaxID=317 RepID=UPI001F113709|nr:hypothetical protein [Pseudomonas syringae]MCH5548245.1 hypothetical protein [Pseudomonas syringae pv. syringae]
MNYKEAAGIVRSMADSIQSNPAQFKIEVSVVGQSIVSHGGIGLQVSAVGGGPGSTTIGNQVTLGSTQVKFATQAADRAIGEQLTGLVKALNDVADQFESEKPDKGIIQSIIASLAGTWVPPVISAAITAVTGMTPA